MEVTLESEWIKDFSATLLKSFGWKRETNFHRNIKLALYDTTPKQIDMLFEEVSKFKSTSESREVIATIKRWREVLADKNPRAANAKSATELLSLYIAKNAEGFRLWKNVDGNWFGFFVSDIEFHAENRRNGTPATVEITMDTIVFGSRDSMSVHWTSFECRGKTAAQLLASFDLAVETPEIREHYERSVVRHSYFCSRIGTQCHTSGQGFGELGDHGSMSRIRYNSKRRQCKLNGQPGLVVIDTVDDDPDEAETMRLATYHTSNTQLSILKAKLNGTAEYDDSYIAADDEVVDEEYWTPIHPLVPVFDLIRHERYAVHSLDLEQYEYNLKLGDKLILPENQKNLLQMLVKSSGSEFKDIVANKSGGTVILLAGKPGLGKTLSAEVFSECSERPLYRVQCSQLGIDSDTIESELAVVFRRARRWGAVILLDEADLYIGERGTDMQRNAIVCVFLRVLETSDGVMFLTTNLPETVDDAIASRCIARIDVKHPNREALLEIWEVLLTQAGVCMWGEDVDYFCDTYNTMGGRDVKAAIKLAMVEGGDQDISRQAMEFVLGFHPNRGQWENHGRIVQ